MVTKTLSMKDPLIHTEPAKEALRSELEDLRAQDVWDEDAPMEYSDAIVQHPDAHFARVFPIFGIKHFEELDATKHKWKARIVLSGDCIRHCVRRMGGVLRARHGPVDHGSRESGDGGICSLPVG